MTGPINIKWWQVPIAIIKIAIKALRDLWHRNE